MFNKFLSPGNSSGGAFDGNPSAGNQQEPDYKKLYEDLLKKTEKLIDPDSYDVSKDKRYAGLMTTLQKEQQAKETFETQLRELTTTHKALETQHATVTQSAATLQTQLDELAMEKDSLATKQTRAALIMKEFPQLASFEADGLLPETGPDDDEGALKTLFQKFSDRIGAVKQETKQTFGAGGLPNGAQAGGASSNVKVTAQAEQHLAQEAIKAGKVAEYNEHYSKYLELTKTP